MYKDLNGKFEALSNHVKKLDTQVAQTTEVLKRRDAEIKAKAALNAISSTVVAVGEDGNSEGDSEAHDLDLRRGVMVVKPQKDIVHIPDTPCQAPPPKTAMRVEATRPRDVEQTLKIADPNPKGLRVIEKEPDPGQFFIDCSVDGIVLKDSLCDTGANVNVMSQAVARKLGIRDFKRSRISVEIPNAVEMTPLGYVPDVMLEIGGCLVPTDFQILKVDDDPNRPIILGSPFLATVGAVADFKRHRMCFTKINKKQFYPLGLPGSASCMRTVKGRKMSKPPWNSKIDKHHAESSNRSKQAHMANTMRAVQCAHREEPRDGVGNVRPDSTNAMDLIRVPVDRDLRKKFTSVPEKRREKVEYRYKDVEEDPSASILSS